VGYLADGIRSPALLLLLKLLTRRCLGEQARLAASPASPVGD